LLPVQFQPNQPLLRSSQEVAQRMLLTSVVDICCMLPIYANVPECFADNALRQGGAAANSTAPT
jgi:hypothetical protein